MAEAQAAGEGSQAVARLLLVVAAVCSVLVVTFTSPLAPADWYKVTINPGRTSLMLESWTAAVGFWRTCYVHTRSQVDQDIEAAVQKCVSNQHLVNTYVKGGAAGTLNRCADMMRLAYIVGLAALLLLGQWYHALRQRASSIHFCNIGVFCLLASGGLVTGCCLTVIFILKPDITSALEKTDQVVVVEWLIGDAALVTLFSGLCMTLFSLIACGFMMFRKTSHQAHSAPYGLLPEDDTDSRDMPEEPQET